MPVPSTQWPLVGRADELERLARLRAQGSFPGAVLAGPAGVGKSRLAREALAVAEAEGAFVLRVQATRSAASVPLFALAGLMLPVDRPESPMHLLPAIVQTLRERAEGRAILLGVDDAQLLDHASATVVLELATSGIAFVLATIRVGDPAPDAVISLWKDAGAPRLELALLDDGAASALLEAALNGPVEHGARHALFEMSGGNVLYLRGLVLGALESGALARRDGLWRLTRPLTPAGSLIELIGARLDGLSEPERAAVELLALGEPLSLDEAVELIGEDALVATETRGIVVAQAPADGGEVRLAHPLFGEVVRERLATVRARSLRVRLAETVSRRLPLSAEDALRVVRWQLQAGAPVATELLLVAGRTAAASGDTELTAQIAARAVAANGGVHATLLMARAHTARRQYAAAEAALAEAEETIDDPDLAQVYLAQRVHNLAFGLREVRALDALLERAGSWWPDPSWQRRLVPLRALRALFDLSADATSEDSEALADPHLDSVRRRTLELARATNLYLAGATREAFELVSRLVPELPLGGRPEEAALTLWWTLGFQCGYAVDEQARVLPERFAAAIRLGDHAAAGHLAAGLAGLARRQGRFHDNVRWLGEAQVHFERVDTFGLMPMTWAFQIGAAHAAGNAERAEELLVALRASLAGDEPIPFVRPAVIRGEAWAALAADDPPRARELLLAGAADVARSPLFAAELLYDAFLAGEPARNLLMPFAAVRERCDAPLVAAYADHVAAAAERNPAALVAACDAFEVLDWLYYGMHAAADAARAFMAAGRQDSARRAAQRALRLQARGQSTTPLPLGGIAVATPSATLTRREAQLIELARRGLTNQEIADRLVLSVRTVESHLYRAMTKLGISDRRKLNAAPH